MTPAFPPSPGAVFFSRASGVRRRPGPLPICCKNEGSRHDPGAPPALQEHASNSKARTLHLDLNSKRRASLWISYDPKARLTNSNGQRCPIRLLENVRFASNLQGSGAESWGAA